MRSHLIRLYKMFFYGSYKLIRFRPASHRLQNNGGLRFTNHCTVLKVTSQLGKEVIECFGIFTGQFFRTESHQIQIFHNGIRQNGNLSPIPLCLADIPVFFQGFLIQIIKSLILHSRYFFRQCLIRKQRKPDEQPGDITCDITVAGHTAKPTPCAFLTLQFFQFKQRRHITVI